MKISDAIKQLQKHDPNEEIVFYYWAKDLFEDDDMMAFASAWNQMLDAIEKDKEPTNEVSTMSLLDELLPKSDFTVGDLLKALSPNNGTSGKG